MHFSVMRATYVKDGFTFVDLEEMPIVEGQGGEKVGIDWEWFMDLKGRIREDPPATLRDALLGLGHDEVGIDVAVLLSKVSERKEEWEQPDHLAKLRDEVGLASSFTIDQALAIWVYTLQVPNVFERMNALMNDKAGRATSMGMAACLPYIRFLLTALKALPTSLHYKGKLKRGIKWVYESPDNHDPCGYFPRGKQIAWYGFKSCARDRRVMISPSFCGKIGPRTIFHIEAKLGYDILHFSAFPNEAEVLLPPLTRLLVIACSKNIIDPLHPRKDSSGNLLPGEVADQDRSGFPDQVLVEQLLDDDY